MRKLITIILLVFQYAYVIIAQNISVASFKMLPNDLTANTQGTIVYDQNGEKCALIKVETTQTGFSFDAGSLGVCKTEQHPAEVWVYVPDGVKRLSISHPQLGIVRDYDLGTSVQKAKTYLLKLTTGRVTTVVNDAVTSQFLLFKVEPKDATVLVNDESWRVNEGIARKYVPFGTYNYRVMCQDYFTESGVVTVNDPNIRHEVNVALKPNFVRVTLQVENNAEIWINGECKGQGTWTGNIGVGDYVCETRKAGHRTVTTSISIEPTSVVRTIILNAPTPIYGKLIVSTLPDEADILIDGVKVGTTPSMIQQVLDGVHQVTVRKSGYRDYTQTITIAEGQTSHFEGEQEKGYASTVTESTPNTNPTTVSIMNNVQTFMVNGVSFNMVAVQGGTFQMGATSEQMYCDYEEYPEHSVTLSDFCIGETEVTQELWQAVMGNNPSKFSGTNNPVEKVSWNDCQMFIRELNKLSGAKFRLPTEAEWEYAARGGNKSRGYMFSGSNNIDEVAWYNCNEPHPVKTKQSNELGLYDMSGNVWEWCQDKYGKYSVKSETNPKRESSGSGRVLRGGSWFNSRYNCRNSKRLKDSSGDNDRRMGLRLAL